tara:strand:+ start:36 stop:590 length:555 start_codon:yes stop_codon:yes gene_type:complete
MDLASKIERALYIANKLKNIKYLQWTKQSTDTDIMFCCDHTLSYKKLKEVGINCTGVINFIRLKLGLKLPDARGLRGGTYFWHNYFKTNNMLEIFDYTKNYPIGTLFLRRYRNEIDQGHVAIYFKKSRGQPDKLLYGDIIHAWYNRKPTDGMVCTSMLGTLHFSPIGGKKGYFEYAIHPKYWLN